MSDLGSWQQKVLRIQTGIRVAIPSVVGPQEAIITRVGKAWISPAGGGTAKNMNVVWFNLPNTTGPEAGFGPAPYDPIPGYIPAMGDVCIIVAVSNDTGRLYTVAFPSADPPRIYSGSGAPTIAGVAGDAYIRLDTPGTSLQWQYACTVTGDAAGSPSPATWVGKV